MAGLPGESLPASTDRSARAGPAGTQTGRSGPSSCVRGAPSGAPRRVRPRGPVGPSNLPVHGASDPVRAHPIPRRQAHPAGLRPRRVDRSSGDRRDRGQAETGLCFGPDSLAEARNRGYRLAVAGAPGPAAPQPRAPERRASAAASVIGNGTFTSSGLALHRYLAVPHGVKERLPGLVMCHGFPVGPIDARQSGGTFPELIDRIANELGWAALTFNFRGCGRSDGDFSLQGWVDDLRAAIDHLRAEADPLGIWLVGTHTGGSLATCVAANDPRINGVAVLGARADFDDWADQSPAVPRTRPRGRARSAPPGFPRQFDEWTREFRRFRPVGAAQPAGAPVAARPARRRRRVGARPATLASSPRPTGRRSCGSSPVPGHRLRHDPRAVAILLGWLDRQKSALLDDWGCDVSDADASEGVFRDPAGARRGREQRCGDTSPRTSSSGSRPTPPCSTWRPGTPTSRPTSCPAPGRARRQPGAARRWSRPGIEAGGRRRHRPLAIRRRRVRRRVRQQLPRAPRARCRRSVPGRDPSGCCGPGAACCSCSRTSGWRRAPTSTTTPTARSSPTVPWPICWSPGGSRLVRVEPRFLPAHPQVEAEVGASAGAAVPAAAVPALRRPDAPRRRTLSPPFAVRSRASLPADGREISGASTTPAFIGAGARARTLLHRHERLDGSSLRAGRGAQLRRRRDDDSTASTACSPPIGRRIASRSWWSTTARSTASPTGLNAEYPAVRVLEPFANLGFAGGCNLGHQGNRLVRLRRPRQQRRHGRCRAGWRRWSKPVRGDERIGAVPRRQAGLPRALSRHRHRGARCGPAEPAGGPPARRPGDRRSGRRASAVACGSSSPTRGSMRPSRRSPREGEEFAWWTGKRASLRIHAVAGVAPTDHEGPAERGRRVSRPGSSATGSRSTSSSTGTPAGSTCRSTPNRSTSSRTSGPACSTRATAATWASSNPIAGSTTSPPRCSRGAAARCCSTPPTWPMSDYFDERLFLYYEDTDLSWRGSARGLDVRLRASVGRAPQARPVVGARARICSASTPSGTGCWCWSRTHLPGWRSGP